MSSESSAGSSGTSPSYYRGKLAAPYLCDALMVNHYDHGWLSVLEARCDTHSDTIVAALADPETGDFHGLYLSDYTIYEDLIVDAEMRVEHDPVVEEDSTLQPADELVAGISGKN